MIHNKKLEHALQKVQKPGRYVGGELNSVVKDPSQVEVRFAFCFPDTYEIGMSHLGIKILYGAMNEIPYFWCERVFAPWVDMEEEMRREGIPLYALESGDPVSDFDFIGFTLQYELSYTNVLNMLELAGIPLRSKDRTELRNIVVGGGPCACNPEPLADFFDIFFLGDGEEVDIEVMELYRQCKKEGKSKLAFLEQAAQIQGVYVPAFYDVTYNEDGTVKAYTPTHGAPATVKKRNMMDMDKSYYPKDFVVPLIDVVHNRISEEVLRGCIRGCRFCQAGFLYRPYREKSIETMATEPSVSASVGTENLPQTEDQIKEHITHALMRYAAEHKAAIRTAANRTAQDSSAARSQLPAPPAGLFVPSRFFSGPIALWISPLQALGLAVSCTREVSEAADNESESQTETMIALYRHSPGNPLPETGVLFPFFESVSAAIWWVEHMTEFHSRKLSEATRKDVLKQFLFTDAMARLLRLFIRESRKADQEIGHRMLAQSAALTQNQTGERTKRELQKFVKPKLLRKLCSASIAEVAHGYLTHELRRKGEADVSTGLEIVLDIQKRKLAAARSKRMKRVVARPDS